MPDNNGNTTNNSTGNPDILSELQGYINSSNQSRNNALMLLKSIDQTTKQILQSGGGMSASNAYNMMPGYRGSSSTYFQSRARYHTGRGVGSNPLDEFTTGLGSVLAEEFIGREFKDKIRDIRDKLARDIGVSVEDLPNALGNALGKQITNAVKNSNSISDFVNNMKSSAGGMFSKIHSTFAGTGTSGAQPSGTTSGASAASVRAAMRGMSGSSRATSRVMPSGNLQSAFTMAAQTVIISASSVVQEATSASNGSAISIDNISSIMDALGGEGGASGLADLGASSAGTELASLSTSAAESGAAIEGLSASAAIAAPEVLLVVAALAALADAVEPLVNGIKKVFESLKNAANRYEKSREENLKLAQARMKADFETMVKEPFDILKSAAQNLYDAWDNNVRVINGTQGYDKDQLYDLIGDFADRLRAEGLERVVSSDAVTNNLAKVLESGLSGKVAEEFAYIATKLNAAIPTEDFFNYASTYSSIAANAIQQGMSQSAAISYANSQLEAFAGNLLYASREISGGFTTGLKDASSIFQQSVQIAQAGKTNNATEISGVMTAVSAIVGAIAPDLANSMTDAIYKAATGGNSSEIVALRSLAGINASNTEFLKQLSDNPQKVFATLFENLGNMQKMSDGAYMEVAEGLSSVFGVSMDAFARVDFNYLAQAISSMNTSSDALDKNIALLASGQTTTNAEQLKMQQINEYMWNEGLAYVMDNAAARSIQEHMWDEQLARELMEATYGVEIQGAALEFIEGIRKTVDNILGFLNPFKLLSKITNVIGSIEESKAQDVDVTQLLELGKLGKGNAAALYNLTTRNADLNLTRELVDLMGGVSAYNVASTSRKFTSDMLYTGWNNLFDATVGGQGMRGLYALASANAGAAGQRTTSLFSGKSAYNWGTIGKSTAGALSKASVPSAHVTGLAAIEAAANTTSASARAQKIATQNLTNMLKSMDTFVADAIAKGDTPDYDAWVKSASSANRISDFSAALKDAGLTEEAVRSQFDAATTQSAQTAEKERKLREEKFWTDTVDLLTVNNDTIQQIFDKQTEFFKSVVDYFIDHLVYSDAYSHSDVTSVQKKEKDKSETAVYALAQALTKNTTDLLDPTVQTNVILAQILKLVNVLVQQGTLSTDAGAMSNVLSNMATGNWEISVPTSKT